MNPLIPLLGLGGIVALFLAGSSNAASPVAAPVPLLPPISPPPGAPSTLVSKNGHTWKLVILAGLQTDVFAPAGSWGPHGELRVLRFKSPAPRTLMGKAEGVPEAVFLAAMKDLDIKVISVAPTVMTPPGRPPMPVALQQEMIALGLELGVDSMGIVRGPVKAAGVQHATELASRLDQAGYSEAGAVVRKQATDAARMVPIPPPTVLIPGVPLEIQTAIARAMQLERDPLKLETLKHSLLSLPQSPERDMLINALDALILQIRTAQAVAAAAVEIDQAMRPAVTAVTAPKPRLLKLNMKGEDVKAWQLVIGVPADGIYGPKTDAATRTWQRAHGLKADGIVGPATLAAIGRAPTPAVTTALPAPTPIAKSPREMTAAAVATHLLALQAKHGVKASKGKQDMALIKRFQSDVGGVADGLPGVNTMVALARAGQGRLPRVMYWPKNGTKSKDLPAYRVQLANISATAKSAGLPALAAAITQSAMTEDGSGMLT